jgi:hypothetical protein
MIQHRPHCVLISQGRFGNVAFRTWLEQVKVISRPFLESLGLAPERVAELEPYVAESFGNKTRIDYGTGLLHLVFSAPFLCHHSLPREGICVNLSKFYAGHELNFVALLCCLSKLELLAPSDASTS